jgi:hypothetical protein
MGMSDTLIRGRLQHKYHYCGRCGVRYPLSRMVWQSSGKGRALVCLANCYDTRTDLQRDADITRVEEVAQNNPDLLPDVKLTDGATVDIDEISFVP